jgi:hypothetical protein
MSSTELKALLQAEKQDALGVNTSALAAERARALDYYYGNMARDMPSTDGRSSAVSTDVADSVEGLMPALIEIFASTEEAVRFNPVGPEDEEAAEQETDYVNHVFMQRNPGFLVLYTFIKDALLSKVGVVKVFWEESERQETETYLDQGDDVFALLAAAPDVEIVAHTEHVDETGQRLHDVTLSTRKRYGCARVVPVPPEEFGISKRARSIVDASYCYHEVQRSESDLIQQGYDAAQVKALPSWGDVLRAEALARDTIEVGSRGELAADTLNTAMRPIKVTEHYIRMDYEGSAQLYRVTTGGDELEVLRRQGEGDVVAVDVMPFAAMTPVIVTHRFFGRSIADLVMDIQKIKTALLRALLDNAYLANNQRVTVVEALATERTLDDLLVARPGGVVRTKGPGAIEPIPNQPMGDFVFPLIQYVDATREWRTGVTKLGQGIDANALQNQSATAVAQAFSMTQAKMKLIARIFAETGIRDLFALLHGVIRKNDRQVNTVRLRNRWVTVDPRNWKTREDMTINVGLGTGSKDAQIAHLMTVLGIQKEAIAAPQLGLVTPKNIYNTLRKLVEKIDLKSVQPYFTDPDAMAQQAPQGSQAPPQPPPDPRLIHAQGMLQLRAQKAQADAQAQAHKLQADAQMQQQKLATDAQLKVRQQDLAAELERERMALDAQNRLQQTAIDGHVRNASRPIVPGGQG